MGMPATRMELVAVLADLPLSAEASGDLGSVPRGAHGPHKPPLALKNPGRGGKPGAREIRRQDSVESSFTRMEVFAHRAVGIEFPEPCCLSACTPEGIDRLLRVQLHQRSCRRSRSECGDGTGWMPKMIVAGIDRLADS